MLVVIDYGISNIGSLINMLKKIGIEAKVTDRTETIQMASKIILPGIGAFDAGMKRLNELGIIDSLNKKVLDEKVPTLGICLGMQLMAQQSEEGQLQGLSWFDAEVVKFQFPQSEVNYKIPHMGWNFVEQKKESRLLQPQPSEKKFYFVHSYHLKMKNESDILATTHHGYAFTSAIEKDNVMGVQFHPEKSHKFGFQLVKNFVEKF